MAGIKASLNDAGPGFKSPLIGATSGGAGIPTLEGPGAALPDPSPMFSLSPAFVDVQSSSASALSSSTSLVPMATASEHSRPASSSYYRLALWGQFRLNFCYYSEWIFVSTCIRLIQWQKLHLRFDLMWPGECWPVYFNRQEEKKKVTTKANNSLSTCKFRVQEIK